MKDVEAFIADLPQDEKRILQHLRTFLFEVEPRFREKLSYDVPYYFLNHRVCFLWPASAPLKPKTATDTKVLLGFCKGYLLSTSRVYW
jgi:hypothetical protein